MVAMPVPMPMDYLAALTDTIVIEGGGRAYVVRPASLLTFFRLQQALPIVDDVDRILTYLSLALDEPREAIDEWGYSEVLTAYAAITALNQPHSLHIDYAKGGDDKGGAASYEYNGRALASIVTRLAAAFGWSRYVILNEITYDEARCYLQELTIADHGERAYLYSLSEVGYDQHGKPRPFPALAIPARLPSVPVTVNGSAVPKAPTDERYEAYGVVTYKELQKEAKIGR